MTVAVKSPLEHHHKPVIDEVMRRARAAFESFRDVSQERADEAVRALAWSVYKPEHARELAALAVADTGLGNVSDKIVKNQRKTFGTLRDLLRAKSVGVIEEDKSQRHRQIRQAHGRHCRIDAVDQSRRDAGQQGDDGDQGAQRRRHRAVAARLRDDQAHGRTTCAAALAKAGLPADLVQMLPPPVTKELTEALMKAADLVVITGSQDNVRRG